MNHKDAEYMAMALELTKLSEDESRKTACLFVSAGGVVRGSGYNRFPDRVARLPERLLRPAKYAYTEHAERVAIYQAARVGVPLWHCTVYLPWFPCADCARALVGVGAVRLVCYEPDWTEERYGFRDAEAILKEGGVAITYMPGSIGELK